ncbi:MAG: hypothetical protein CMJ39_08935 [Phycisphaerae bacterium]|nr:hypothetical protein [Phycisphaerae bacterium]|tara:strand:+ start:292 stop:1329 length:1038 start_codon:yes stop_codon:yes gene_type:complete
MKCSVAITVAFMACAGSLTADEIIVPTHAHAASSMKTMHPDPIVNRQHMTAARITHVPSSSAINFATMNQPLAGYGNMWMGGMPGLAGVPLVSPVLPMNTMMDGIMPMGMMMGDIGMVDPVIATDLPPLTGLPMLATTPISTMPLPMQSTSIMAQAMGVWSERTPGATDLQSISMFAVQPVEPRLFHVHDLVQIIVREASVAASFQGLETEKEIGLAGGVEAFPGVNKFDPINYTEFEIEGEKEFDGEGEYVREDELVTRLTAEVIEIRPNGNLVLEARTRIRTDDEEWYTQLTGVARPVDVTAANTILSNQIFDLQIEKRHKGEVPSAASKGILAQALDAIFAF